MFTETDIAIKSLRSSERGLKYKYDGLPVWSEDVAPFVGAWIEICSYCHLGSPFNVAPFVGAWIEIE